MVFHFSPKLLPMMSLFIVVRKNLRLRNPDLNWTHLQTLWFLEDRNLLYKTLVEMMKSMLFPEYDALSKVLTIDSVLAYYYPFLLKI